MTIAASGSFSVAGTGQKHLDDWDCRRTVLRQDEVSRFVHSTKGEKYSVLLPLLGLSHLDTRDKLPGTRDSTFVPELFDRHGLFEFDVNKGITPKPLSELERYLRARE